jgi:DNA-binding IclR family transcriptional regulator
MMISTSKHPPIEFSGSVAELATTLGLPVSEIVASIAGLIERGNLERVTGNTWRLRPLR